MTEVTEIPDAPAPNSFGAFVVASLVTVLVAVGLAASLAFEYGLGVLLLSVAMGGAFYFVITSGLRLRPPDIMAKPRRDLFDDLPVPMIEAAENGIIRRANEAALALIGQNDLVGQDFADVVEGMGRSIRDRMADTMKGHSLGRGEMARCYPDGQEVFLKVAMSRMTRGGETSVLMLLSDETELKSLEAQFVQSQKMQAVGQLAGGVAHDFNNILTAITGHADLLLLRSNLRSPEYADLDQIKQNANRAAALVRQLLAFSRKQTLQPKSIRLDDTLADLSHLLNRLLGEKVVLQTDHGKDLKRVRVDVRQFEQVIMNLVVNARDAMVEGGTVHIRTRNVTLREELRRDRAIVHPGEYVVVEVEDTGMGIAPDQVAKIFEPFFTTKKQGEGTGLGLSTVYGIVKQTGGFVFVDSDPGKGTRFIIYLPVNEMPDEVVEVPVEKPAQDLTGRGRILLVEDEDPVRAFAARALTLRGYSVTEAASGEEALEILSHKGVKFDVFVSDVVMPGKDGPTWVREAMINKPDAKVVFVSGYAEDAFKDGQPDIPHSSFLAKPFSLVELTQKVKEQIEA